MVFISYSSLDIEAAEMVCAALESRTLRCWMAPRNIRPGQEWGAAILDGLTASSEVVVVFSKHANASPQVRRELAHAARRDLRIAVVRLDDTEPIATFNMFKAEFAEAAPCSIPLEERIARLAETIGSSQIGAAKAWVEAQVQTASGIGVPIGLLHRSLTIVWVLTGIRVLVGSLALGELATDGLDVDAARQYLAFNLPCHFAGLAGLGGVFVAWLSSACSQIMGWPPDTVWRSCTTFWRAALGTPLARVKAWGPMLLASLLCSAAVLFFAALGMDEPGWLLVIGDTVLTLLWAPTAWLTVRIASRIDASYENAERPRTRAAATGP